MKEEFHIPVRSPGEGHRWTYTRPMFTFPAVLLALVSSAAEFTYQYQTRWTRLQRLYLSAYVRTAHLVSTFPVLMVAYPHETRVACAREVVPFSAATDALPGTVAFSLSQLVPDRWSGNP